MAGTHLSDVSGVVGGGAYRAVMISSGDVTDATATGRSLMKAADAAGARSAIAAASQTSVDGKAPKLVERGAFSTSTAYSPGDVVTYSHSRWCCATAVAAGTWSAASWIRWGLDAVAATTDPGGGQLWVKI